MEKPDFWDSHCSSHGEDGIEWYTVNEDLLDALQPYLRSIKARGCIASLQIGVGTSTFGDLLEKSLLCEAGAESSCICSISHLDFSPASIAFQHRRLAECSTSAAAAEEAAASAAARYVTADVRELPSASSIIDCIFDKGTFDAILARREPATLAIALQGLSECLRVLRKQPVAVEAVETAGNGSAAAAATPDTATNKAGSGCEDGKCTLLHHSPPFTLSSSPALPGCGQLLVVSIIGDEQRKRDWGDLLAAAEPAGKLVGMHELPVPALDGQPHTWLYVIEPA